MSQQSITHTASCTPSAIPRDNPNRLLQYCGFPWLDGGDESTVYSQRWPASEGILTERSRLSLGKRDGRDLDQHLFLFERREELLGGRWSCWFSGSSSIDESGKLGFVISLGH
jgi:hypothetical protein